MDDLAIMQERSMNFVDLVVNKGPLDRMIQRPYRDLTMTMKQAYTEQIESVWRSAIGELRSHTVSREILARVGYYGPKLHAEKQGTIRSIENAEKAWEQRKKPKGLPPKRILRLILKAFKFINSSLKSLKAVLPQMHIIEEFKELLENLISPP